MNLQDTREILRLEVLVRPAMGSQVVIILMEKFLKNYQDMMQEKW